MICERQTGRGGVEDQNAAMLQTGRGGVEDQNAAMLLDHTTPHN